MLGTSMSNVHNSEEYLKIVRELIFVGHIHTFSKHKRIITNGSLDRLSHGEEEAKGHVRVTVTDEGRDIVFVENKGAKIFRSVDCSGLTLDETIAKIDKYVKLIPDGSHIRVIGNSVNPIFTNMASLIRQYPLLVWSKLVKNIDNAEEIIEKSDDSIYIPITITKENIKKLLLDRIINSSNNPNVLSIAEEILCEVI